MSSIANTTVNFKRMSYFILISRCLSSGDGTFYVVTRLSAAVEYPPSVLPYHTQWTLTTEVCSELDVFVPHLGYEWLTTCFAVFVTGAELRVADYGRWGWRKS